MAPRGKKSAHSVDDWLIEPNRPSDDPESVEDAAEPESAQWVVDHWRGGPNGRVTEPAMDIETVTVSSKGPGRTRKEPDRTPQQDRGFEETRRALEEQRTRIGRLEKTLAERERELAELEGAIAEREAEFKKTLKKREAQIEQQVSDRFEKRETDLNESFERRQAEHDGQLTALEARLEGREVELREQPRMRSKTNGKLDANGASFEQLRGLGLSVTQSARVIAYRDTRHGFDSVDELDRIPGLPNDTRRTLKSQLIL